MRITIWILSFPYVLVSLFLRIFHWSEISRDLKKCLEVAETHRDFIPQVFIDALIACEDRRNLLHPGIDPISMFRAVYVFTVFGKIQGASTIEQQFVRVVLNRYERTFARKFREQIVAVLLTSTINNKKKIASSYLSIAFYGSSSIGVRGLKSKFGNELKDVSFEDALRMVAQLKYPRPLYPNEEWQRKINRRIDKLLKYSEKNKQACSVHATGQRQ